MAGERPGLDTVALCGGTLDDRHGWTLTGMDIHTTWTGLRGLPNRGKASVCGRKRRRRTPSSCAGKWTAR